MESADMATDTPNSQSAIASQGILQGQHHQSIRTLMNDRQGTNEQIARLTDQVTALIHLVSSTQPSQVNPASQALAADAGWNDAAL